MSSHTGVTNSDSKLPRAVIHKKILDEAESSPGASVEEIATAINGASVALVERVFDEYGDPAASDELPDGAETSNGELPDDDGVSDGDASGGGESPVEVETAVGTEATETTEEDEGPTGVEPADGHGTANGDPSGGTVTAPSEDEPAMSRSEPNGSMSKTETNHVHQLAQQSVELTEKQREVLRAIRESPDATQSELANRFGVTQSTINNRLNSIEGFDWKHRHAFTESMLDDSDTTESRDGDGDGAASDGQVSNRLDELAAQVATLERRLEEPARSAGSPFDDPDLACKVVRACINSEDVTTDEEDRIMKAVISSPHASNS